MSGCGNGRFSFGKAHSCSVCRWVQASDSPFRLNPSAGLESLSIHSIHSRHDSRSRSACVNYAIWVLSSTCEDSRINVLQAASLSMKTTTSRPQISLWNAERATGNAAVSDGKICCLRGAHIDTNEAGRNMQHPIGSKGGSKYKSMPICGRHPSVNSASVYRIRGLLGLMPIGMHRGGTRLMISR